MAYCTVDDVKPILHIETSDDTHNPELEGCITSSDALIDTLLKKTGLSVPESTPQNIIDASAYFAAWLFRGRRDPESAEEFLHIANRFLDAYSTAKKGIVVVGTD